MMDVKEYVMIFSLFLMYSCFMFGVGNVIYITPSLRTPCPIEHCLTLSQFANDSSLGSFYTTLIILQGNHTLDASVNVKNISKLVIHSSSSVPSLVICQDNETSLRLERIGEVWIRGLKFVGCGNNKVLLVNQLTIEYTTFLGQNCSGTALEIVETNATILHSCFDSNTVGSYRGPLTMPGLKDDQNLTTVSTYIGGALIATKSSVKVVNSSFVKNHAALGGAIFSQSGSNITMINNTLSENCACLEISGPCFGGALYSAGNSAGTSKAQLVIISCTFSYNEALHGAAISSLNTDINITLSTFHGNTVYRWWLAAGGALDLYGQVSLIIDNSQFHNNTAGRGGGVVHGGQSVVINHSDFWNNRVVYFGGVILASYANMMIKNCRFENNSAFQGGVLNAFQCSITVYQCAFDGNIVHSSKDTSGTPLGGAICITDYSNVTISRSLFRTNAAVYGVGGVLGVGMKVKLTVDNCTFVDNQASSGGVIGTSQSNIIFSGTCSMVDNTAEHGGVIKASGDATLNVYDEVIVNNNTSNDSGGGMYLYRSRLNCQSNCTLKFAGNNAAVKGGGIHAVNSIITIFAERDSQDSSSVHFIENNAYMGGGIYLELSAELQLIKSGPYYIHTMHNLYFNSNTADYGGALYVADETNFDMCTVNHVGTECFLQILSTTYILNKTFGIDSVDFIYNSARKIGSVLYGGLLDRCTLSLSTEILLATKGVPVDGVAYFNNVTRLSKNEGVVVSSSPVRVCLCRLNGQPDCSYKPLPIQVKKGENLACHLLQLIRSIRQWLVSPFIVLSIIRKVV